MPLLAWFEIPKTPLQNDLKQTKNFTCNYFNDRSSTFTINQKEKHENY
jgi:hypothetical protein